MDKQFLPCAGKYVITVPQDAVLELHEPEHGEGLSVELFLQEGARVVYHTGYVKELSLKVVLAAQSTFEQVFLSKHAEKRKQCFVLSGKQAHVQVTGSYALEQDILATLEVIQLHKSPHTVSNVTIKTVLQGKAQFHYHGTITIEQEAQGSKAHQENKNLIVSEHAQARSIPVLEVLADDVQCGHGSAISYVQEDHLFYLVSRGVSQEQAKKMIIIGFLHSFS